MRTRAPQAKRSPPGDFLAWEDPPKKKKKTFKALKKGQIVAAQFKGKGKFYKARISKVLDDDEYNIDFDDGDKDKNVARKCIKPMDDESSSDSDSGERYDERYDEHYKRTR